MENVHEQITKAHIELSEEALEKLVLKQVMNPESADNCIFVKQYFKSHFFKNTDFSFLYNIVNNYWKIYNKQPTIETLISIFDNEKLCDKKEKFLPIIKDIYNISENNYDIEFVKNNLINFTKGRAIYFAILDNLDDIEKTGNIGNCLERFEDIVKIGISDDVGTEYFENIDKHCQELTNVEQRIPFGFKEWDKYTYGGIPTDTCLFMIMAQPGLGKSQMMMNIGYQWLLQNKNVLMISLEMSEQMYSSRMSALFSDINVNELKDNIITLKHKVSVAKLSAPSARLYIKQYSPNEFNAIKLKSILKKLADTKKFKPDLIIVDYLNIMTTNNSSYHLNSYERVGTISKELRSVSIETKIPILSSTQSNRSLSSGYAGADISMSNTSDSAGINMDADALFALFQLEGERELGRINVKILKNRLGGFVDTIFPMSVNYDTLKISDWGSFEDDEFDEIGGINTTSNNIGKNNVNTGKNNINNLFDED